MIYVCGCAGNNAIQYDIITSLFTPPFTPHLAEKRPFQEDLIKSLSLTRTQGDDPVRVGGGVQKKDIPENSKKGRGRVAGKAS